VQQPVGSRAVWKLACHCFRGLSNAVQSVNMSNFIVKGQLKLQLTVSTQCVATKSYEHNREHTSLQCSHTNMHLGIHITHTYAQLSKHDTHINTHLGTHIHAFGQSWYTHMHTLTRIHTHLPWLNNSFTLSFSRAQRLF